MRIIQELSEMIMEETEGADHYVTRALEVKEKYPKLADLLYKLSGEEMGHVAALHDSVTGMIADYKRDHGDPPAEMLAVYNYIHRKQIEKAADVKAKQAMYKGA